MSFSPAFSVSGHLGNIGILSRSSPATVFYKGKLWAFYLGVGNDGVYFTTLNGDGKWAPIANLKNYVGDISVAAATSVSAVAFDERLFVFYNGSANDGTWCTIYDGKNWGEIFSISWETFGMGSLPGTSPNAAVFRNKLYLFWHGSKNEGIFYCTYDGNSWSRQDKVPFGLLARDTSPFAVSFNDHLYLFWNGLGNDGAWWCTFDGDSWSGAELSLSSAVRGMAFLPGTSPSAVALNSKLLRVFWVGAGGASEGLWYADFDTQNWTTQRNMAQDIGGQDLGDWTSPATVIFDKFWYREQNVEEGKIPYIFWKGGSIDLYCSHVI